MLILILCGGEVCELTKPSWASQRHYLRSSHKCPPLGDSWLPSDKGRCLRVGVGVLGGQVALHLANEITILSS